MFCAKAAVRTGRRSELMLQYVSVHYVMCLRWLTALAVLLWSLVPVQGALPRNLAAQLEVRAGSAVLRHSVYSVLYGDSDRRKTGSARQLAAAEQMWGWSHSPPKSSSEYANRSARAVPLSLHVLQNIWTNERTLNESDVAALRQEAYDMFDKGFTNYMNLAFPKVRVKQNTGSRFGAAYCRDRWFMGEPSMPVHCRTTCYRSHARARTGRGAWP